MSDQKRYEPLIDVHTSAYAGLGLVWPVEGSRGDKYNVSLLSHGWHCDCFGFRRAKIGVCKHVVKIDQLVGGDHEDPVYARVGC